MFFGSLLSGRNSFALSGNGVKDLEPGNTGLGRIPVAASRLRNNLYAQPFRGLTCLPAGRHPRLHTCAASRRNGREATESCSQG